jgi:hypothetical protein
LALDAGDDEFHVAAVIQQRSQAGTALSLTSTMAMPPLIMAVTSGDATTQIAAAFDHGRDQQILGRVSSVACRM